MEPLDIALRIKNLTVTIQLLKIKTKQLRSEIKMLQVKTETAIKKKGILKGQLASLADATGLVPSDSSGQTRTKQQRQALGICVECGVELIDAGSTYYGPNCREYNAKQHREKYQQLKEQSKC